MGKRKDGTAMILNCRVATVSEKSVNIAFGQGNLEFCSVMEIYIILDIMSTGQVTRTTKGN